MGTLQRLVVTFKPEGVEIRTLYRRYGEGPNPGTAGRRREVQDLTRSGLREALEALDAGDVEDLGTSGFTTREDVLSLSAASSNSTRLVKGACS